MSIIQIRSDRFTRISNPLPVTVKNLGTSPVFFSALQGVSSAIKDGEIAEGATTEVTVPTYFLVEPPAAVGTNVVGVREQNLELTTTGVQQDILPHGSVTDVDVASTAAIASTKVSVATSASTQPAAGAEKAVVVGVAGVARKVTAVHTGDGAETKVKVKHGLNTEAVDVVVQKGAETKKPGANYLNAAGAGNVTWAPISLTEVEITFGTAPIAKFESFVTVIG